MLASMFDMDARPGLTLSSARKPTTETELRVQLTDRSSGKVVLDESVPWSASDSLEAIGSKITARGLAELLHSDDRRLEFLVWFSDVLDQRSRSDAFNAHDETDISLVRFREGAKIMRPRADPRVLDLLRHCTEYLGEGSYHIVGKACASSDSSSAESKCRACVAVKVTKVSRVDVRRELVEFEIQKLLSEDPEFAPFVPAVFGSHDMNMTIMGETVKKAQTQEFIEPWRDADLGGKPIRSLYDFLEQCTRVLPRELRAGNIDLVKRVFHRLRYIVARIMEFLVRLQARYPGARHNDFHSDNILLSQPKFGVGTVDGDITYAKLGLYELRLDVPRIVIIDWEFGDIPGHVENPQIRQARPISEQTEYDESRSVLQWTGPVHRWVRRAKFTKSSDERQGRCAYYSDMYDFCKCFGRVYGFYQAWRRLRVPMEMRSLESIASVFGRAMNGRPIPEHWSLGGFDQYTFNSLQTSQNLPTLSNMYANYFVGVTVLDEFPRFSGVAERVISNLWDEDRFEKDKDVYMLVFHVE